MGTIRGRFPGGQNSQPPFYKRDFQEKNFTPQAERPLQMVEANQPYQQSNFRCPRCSSDHPGGVCPRDTGGCLYCGKPGHRISRMSQKGLRSSTKKYGIWRTLSTTTTATTQGRAETHGRSCLCGDSRTTHG